MTTFRQLLLRLCGVAVAGGPAKALPQGEEARYVGDMRVEGLIWNVCAKERPNLENARDAIRPQAEESLATAALEKVQAFVYVTRKVLAQVNCAGESQMQLAFKGLPQGSKHRKVRVRLQVNAETYFILIGDTHAAWWSHQDATSIEDFERLFALAADIPGQKLAVTNCQVTPGKNSHVVPDAVIEQLTTSSNAHPVFHIDEPALQALARRLAPLMEMAQTVDERAPLDYLLGGLHALFRARQLGFDDRSVPIDDDYWTGPLTRVCYMQDGNIRTDGKWLAGFYVNAALARTAAAFERIVCLIEVRADGKKRPRKFWQRLEALGWGRWSDPDFILTSGSQSNAYRVYAEVNRLKHDPKALGQGRQVAIGDTIVAFSEVVALCEHFLWPYVQFNGRMKDAP